jgi:dolichol-phosphate mannosyltransferase
MADNFNAQEREILTQDDIFDIYDKNDITIIIPTLNEEKSIGIILDELINEEFENILVIDGFSSDLTVKIAKNYDIKIKMQKGKGKGGAIKTAINFVTTPYIIVMDGDYTYDPKDISKFLLYASSMNLVIGARTKGRENISLLNRFGNWVINKTFNLFFGTKISDVCSGMYFLKTAFAKQLDLNSNGFEIEAEILAQATNFGGIAEVPINYRSRIGKQKLRPFKDGYRIIKKILKMAATYNPITFFSMLIGSSLISLSVFIFILLGANYANLQPLTLLGTLSLPNLGLLILLIGVVTSLQKRLEQKMLNKILMNK